MIISLRAGSRIYINGAVLKVDRRVNVELMNNVTFLLESHVIQPEEATTPLRQLYFAAQTALMSPEQQPEVRQVIENMMPKVQEAFENAQVLASLKNFDASCKSDRYFEALKSLRQAFPVEDAILGRGDASTRVA